MKHTPGPWTADKIGAVYRRSNSKGINQLMVEIKGGGGNEDECRANARLIAAAPELLEALEAALEWIDAVPSDTQLPAMPGFDRDWVNGIIDKATTK